jgi:hypothetical protein
MKTLQHLFENPIRAFALLCVAACSIFLGYVNLKLIDLLSGPDWCGKAIQAERITPGQTFQGLTGCIDIMKLQLGALAKVLLINSGTFALCLGVLVVIVIAGARLAGKLFGGEIDVSRQTSASKAANEVAGAAVGKATEIAQGQTPAPPVPSGPAMPPPPGITP